MKKVILSAIVACFTLVQVQAQEILPHTEVRTLKNQKVAFNTLFEPGKVTLVSFWATWCVPCKKEIANVKELMPEWKQEVDFDFMTVSVDDSRSSAKVASYAAAQRWDFPTYLDPNNDLKRSLNFQTVPFSMIVDGEGKVVYMHNGYEEGAENEMFAKLKEIAGSMNENMPIINKKPTIKTEDMITPEKSIHKVDVNLEELKDAKPKRMK